MTDSPRSILLVCASYPPVLGGSEVEAQRVAAGLRERGHSVTVLTSGPPPAAEGRRRVDPYGTPVWHFGAGRWQDHQFALGVAWTLWRQRHGFDTVYFLMQGLQLVTGLPLSHWLGKRILMKISGSGIIPLMRKSRIGRLELDWLRQWASKIMLLNDGMMAEAAAAGLPPEKLVWMPNPVNTSEFAPLAEPGRTALREELGLRPNQVGIVFLGRLAPEKEVPSLLGAFARVRKKHPEALLVVIGDGPLRAALETQATALGLDTMAVRWMGRLDSSQVRRWLQAADIFTLVSSLEGFSCSLVEAMSCGMASVVSDIPANIQLISDRKTGLLAPLRNEEALAECIGSLIADPGLRQELGSAARSHVEARFSLEQIVLRYEAVMGD